MDSLFCKVEDSDSSARIKSEPQDDQDSEGSDGPGVGAGGEDDSAKNFSKKFYKTETGVNPDGTHIKMEYDSELMGLLPPSGANQQQHLPQHSSLLSKEKKKELKNKREMEEEEREKMQVLVSNFTEDQLDHYEMYRRSAFPRGAIKRLMQTLTGTSISQNVVIAMSGIAKVFVGEVVEEALDVMDTYNETGPLQPKHIREAVRRLRSRGSIPNCRPKRPFIKL